LGLAEALQFLHANGIFHRDITLENIYVCNSESTWKFGDFGTPRHGVDQSSMIKKMSQPYLPPEILNLVTRFKIPAVGEGSWDVYSFAIVVAEIILKYQDAQYLEEHWRRITRSLQILIPKITQDVGLRPYNKVKSPCVCGKIHHADPTCMITFGLGAFLETCWQKDPQERCSIAQVVEFFRKIVNQ
jgi:serine/threonine protein kinase